MSDKKFEAMYDAWKETILTDIRNVSEMEPSLDKLKGLFMGQVALQVLEKMKESEVDNEAEKKEG